MIKFNLMSRAALANAASALGIAAGDNKDAPPASDTPPAEDKPADPAPAEPTTTEPSDTPPAEQPSQEASTQNVVLAADAQAFGAEQFTAGRAAELTRVATVMGSDEGKRNMSMALWMLQSAPGASAEAICAQLKLQPGAAVPNGQSAAIPDTNIDLGRTDPNAALGATDDKKKANDGWDAAIAAATPHGHVIARADSGPSMTAPVTAGGSLQQPAAFRPTGN